MVTEQTPVLLATTVQPGQALTCSFVQLGPTTHAPYSAPWTSAQTVTQGSTVSCQAGTPTPGPALQATTVSPESTWTNLQATTPVMAPSVQLVTTVQRAVRRRWAVQPGSTQSWRDREAAPSVNPATTVRTTPHHTQIHSAQQVTTVLVVQLQRMRTPAPGGATILSMVATVPMTACHVLLDSTV